MRVSLQFQRDSKKSFTSGSDSPVEEIISFKVEGDLADLLRFPVGREVVSVLVFNSSSSPSITNVLRSSVIYVICV
jgi:hypothetical protein